MLALVLLLQPVPTVAMTPGPVQSVVSVSVIVVNQFIQKDECDEKITYRTRWYVSAWDCHYLPTVPGMARVPVWINRGWCRMDAVYKCSNGYAVQFGGVTVVAPTVVDVVSGYDFEYANRTPYWPIGGDGL